MTDAPKTESIARAATNIMCCLRTEPLLVVGRLMPSVDVLAVVAASSFPSVSSTSVLTVVAARVEVVIISVSTMGLVVASSFRSVVPTSVLVVVAASVEVVIISVLIGGLAVTVEIGVVFLDSVLAVVGLSVDVVIISVLIGIMLGGATEGVIGGLVRELGVVLDTVLAKHL